jgi:hypothetical protein
MNKELLDEIITYIEDCEVQIDGEWGSGGTLGELIRDNDMPKLYTKLLALKETLNTQREMKEMYIVQYSVGDWESYTVNVFVTADEEIAKAYVDKFRAKLKKWKDYYKEMFGPGWRHLEGNVENKHYNRFCQVMETNNAYYLKIKLR